ASETLFSLMIAGTAHSMCRRVVRVFIGFVFILLLPKCTPSHVLFWIFWIGSLVALQPEPIPIEVSLQICEPCLRVIGLMIFIRVVVVLDWLMKQIETGEEFECARDDRRWRISPIEQAPVPHLFH